MLGAHHADVVFIAAAYTNVDGARMILLPQRLSTSMERVMSRERGMRLGVMSCISRPTMCSTARNRTLTE